MNLTHQLAHEIQAPLLSLQLQLQRLIEQTPTSELAQSCLDEVAALRNLMAHVLELGDSKLSLQAFELAPLLKRVAQRFRPIAAARRVRLSAKTDTAMVSGDANATERILSNLVDNAIKFSSPNGIVELVTRVGDNTVQLEVRDEGIGMADDARERIFEPFFRLDREAAGNGLGLAISKQLAHAQRGELRCDSELGRGSIFILTLPLASS